MPAIEIPITGIFMCPHCSNTVPMQQIQRIRGRKLYDYYSSPMHEHNYERFVIYQCPTCRKITIIKEFDDEQSIHEDDLKIISETIYPITKQIDAQIIPEYICKLYSEAIKLKPISPDSFSMKIRKALEHICDEHGAKESDNVYNKLDSLSNKGILPKNIIDMGHIIRKVAQYGGHPKDEEITETDADLLDDIFNLILEYIYITPYKIKMLEQKFKKVNK